MNTSALQAYAERVVAAAPPLTSAQVDRVIAVLRISGKHAASNGGDH
ncbi:hypothetical protein [Microbacterium esteraromaticum]|nr:hypothetical protein [Microbacterium esteraromaticum]MBN7792516.1 hypothetical protein [Microbacterium esteraromaticum]